MLIKKSYDINKDKHILIIGKIIKNLREPCYYEYYKWRCKKDFSDLKYEEVVKEKVAGIYHVSYIRTTKKPFGFIFMIYTTTYQFAVKCDGGLFNCECYPK